MCYHKRLHPRRLGRRRLLRSLRRSLSHLLPAFLSLAQVEVPAERERICTCCRSDLGARVEDTIALQCGHAYCKPCILRAVCEYGKTCCLDCRMPISPDWLAIMHAMLRTAQEPRYRDFRLNPTTPVPAPVVTPVVTPVTQPAPTSLYEVCNAVEGAIYVKVVELNTRNVLNGWPLQYHKCKQALWANGDITGTGAATLEDITHLFAELEYKKRGINQPNSFVCQALRNMGEAKLRRLAQERRDLARGETEGQPPINRPEDSVWVRRIRENTAPAAPHDAFGGGYGQPAVPAPVVEVFSGQLAVPVWSTAPAVPARPVNALGEILMVEDPARIREAEALAEAADPRPVHEPAPQPAEHWGSSLAYDAQRPADDPIPQLVEHWGTSAAYAHRPTASYGTYDLPSEPSSASPGTTALENWPGPARVPPPPVDILPQPLSPHSQDIADCLHAGRVMDDLAI